jgi:hypothetical protein
VGKKNWLFISDAEAGERSAILFTVIDACSRRGIDPFEYHREVFTRTPTMVAKDYPGLAPEAGPKSGPRPSLTVKHLSPNSPAHFKDSVLDVYIAGSAQRIYNLGIILFRKS